MLLLRDSDFNIGASHDGTLMGKAPKLVPLAMVNLLNTDARESSTRVGVSGDGNSSDNLTTGHHREQYDRYS